MSAGRGRFYEDFVPGQRLRHAAPRTLTVGDAALYTALSGDRRPLHASRPFAQALGRPRESLHDLLVFHAVFGKSVADISLNAVANLGYADGRFLRPVYEGETLSAESEVLGTREVASGRAGIVWVRTRGLDDEGRTVLSYCRWVMVEKREPERPCGGMGAPILRTRVPVGELVVPEPLTLARLEEVAWALGERVRFADDLAPGERIDHPGATTIEDAEHQLATRLYQNDARVHFDAVRMAATRFGRRLVFGGHVMSVAWALAHDGLEGVLAILAINGGAHLGPTFGGDTLVAGTEVLEVAALPGRDDLAAVRLRLLAAKQAHAPFPWPTQGGAAGDCAAEHDTRLVLDLELWVLMPSRRLP